MTRNYTVLVTPQSELKTGITAIDPATGRPYVIAHVDSAAAAGGDGSVNAPFQTIAAAQSALVGADIVFVHAGSVFHGSAATVTMNNGEMLFGDGTGEQHYINVPNLGSILMPHGPTTGILPVLDSANGTAVTLASNTQLAGFSITNPSGAGLVGNGVSNVFIRDVTVDHAGTDGVQIVNPTGAAYFNNVSITNSAGNGLVVNGGTSYLQYIGTLAGNQGNDLLIENTGVGGVIDMTHAVFPGSGSQGILLQNDSGQINFNNLLVGNTAGPGLTIQGGAGNFQFAGTTVISGAARPPC